MHLAKSLLLDPDDMDISVHPGTDFYRHANGGWISRHPLPPEESRYGTFDLLADQNKAHLRQLFEDFIAGDNEKSDPSSRKITVFFQTGLDIQKSDNLGIDPILPQLERIRAIRNMGGVQEEISRMHALGLTPLFNFYGAADLKDSQLVIAELYQGGLGLSDRDYYLDFDRRSEKIRGEYWRYMQQCFSLSGSGNQEARDRANDVMELETALAERSMSRLDLRDPYKTYHKTSYQGLTEICPEFSWKSFFFTLNIEKPEEINISQPDFFREMNLLIKELGVNKWKSYLEWNWINGFAPYLNEELVNLHFDFYGRILSGKEAIQPRWKRVVQSTNHVLGMLVGKFYVEKHFPPSSKKRMLELVENLRQAMRIRIQDLDWMSDATKEKSLIKLDRIRLKIGYPDKWKDYSDLEIGTDSYAENILRSLTFEHRFNLSKIGKPVDPDEWGMTPQTVNAYFNPSQNEIVFPAAILQPPFFYADGDDALNYGAIGMIIGHELTHGFDDQGRHFDENGNLADWWTEEDAARFKTRAQALVDQFNQYVVMDAITANGELTLGENIADLGGLNISLTAYHNTLSQSAEYPVSEGFSGLQRFFISYARVWANSIRQEELLRRTKEDVHSLGELRVNGPLPNIDLFYQAFGISNEDKLFIEPSCRVQIW